MNIKSLSFIFSVSVLLASCSKDDSTDYVPKINFIFKFDSTQVRLDGLGNPASIPAGHKAQSPRFNAMSAHYLELTKDQLTLLGDGQVLYKAAEVINAGTTAIDFSKSVAVGDGKVFLSVPLSSLAPGTYNWLRVSLAYQNYNVWVTVPSAPPLDATVASFIGFNTYITSFKIKDSTVTVNANKKQGYWAFETQYSGWGLVQQGQAPAGATTVPNPLFATSPVPAGSCVVTGQLASPLVISGSETADINIQVSLSTNKSFEWSDADGNATFDPLSGDAVVDMGIRGMIPRKL